jgi:hypothetical protein
MKKIKLSRSRVSAITIIALFAILTGCQVQEPDRLTAVPFTKVTIADEFWAPRIQTNRKVTIPYDFKKCEQTGRIDNFAKAAGLMDGKFEGIYFNDSDLYKVIEGAAYSLKSHLDPQLEKYVDGVIEKIAAAQWETCAVCMSFTVPVTSLKPLSPTIRAPEKGRFLMWRLGSLITSTRSLVRTKDTMCPATRKSR